ncbi:hypothetical protein OIDMADRAFT_97765, partial [Oidiodendron maius Zn]
HIVYRFIQMIFALAVCGLYGADLHNANKHHVPSDSKWGYAVAVGSLSAISALVYMIPIIVSIPLLFIWDTILFIFWIAVFGVFGKLYIHTDPQGDSGIQRMKNAVWVDLMNALFWLGSAIGMLVYFIKQMRGGRTRYTGRAT